MGVYASAEQLIGATPLLALNRTVQANSLPCRVFAKLEFLNIGGSVKDRVAKRMLDEAEEAGLLKPGGILTVAHGMSRAAIDSHHEGKASKVSIGLMHEDALAAMFRRHLQLTTKISTERMYQIAGRKI